MRIPRTALPDSGCDVLGAPVSVYLEQHRHHLLYEVEPDLSEELADRNAEGSVVARPCMRRKWSRSFANQQEPQT